MNMAEVAGHLTMRIAQLEKGKHGIDASQVIGNLTVRQMNLEQQTLLVIEQLKMMNAQRNAKQVELAKLNGTTEPAPVEFDEAKQREIGLEQLMTYMKALQESLKALDELLAAHAAKDKPAEPVPIVDGEGKQLTASDPGVEAIPEGERTGSRVVVYPEDHQS